MEGTSRLMEMKRSSSAMTCPFGKQHNEKRIWSWIGDLSQVAGIKHYELRVAEQRVQKRLMSVLVRDWHFGGKRSRAGYCMGQLQGHCAPFITPNGVVAPAFFESQGNGFYVAFTRGY